MVKKIKPVLLKGGICLKYEDEHKKYIDRIKKIFTLEHYGFNHTTKIARSYKLYRKHNLLVLPKFGFIQHLNDPETQKPFNKLGIYSKKDIKNHLTSLPKESSRFIWTGKSNLYQKLVVDRVMEDYFSRKKVMDGAAGVVLNLPTGHGKTYVAMALIDKLKIPVLFVCPTIRIADQVRKIMVDMFPQLIVGIFHSKKKVDGDIIIGVVDSFSSCKEFVFSTKTNKKSILKSGKQSKKYKTKTTKYTSKEFFDRWSFVIFDECHNYSTDGCSKIFSRLSATYTLGLSATPIRDNHPFDIINLWNIGPILDIGDIPNYLDVYKEEGDAPEYKGKVIGIKYHGPKEYTTNYLDREGKIVPHKMLEQLMSDPYRVKLIIKEIFELSKKQYCTLIFADRILYLRELKEKLDALLKSISEPESMILDDLDKETLKTVQVTGGAKDHDMDMATHKACVIFTTYPFFKEGISMPRINSIVYATPLRNGYVQTDGRCIRSSTSKDPIQKKKENEKKRIIIDIIDWDVRIKSQWYVRKKAHSKLNEIGAHFEIKMKDVSYEDVDDI